MTKKFSTSTIFIENKVFNYHGDTENTELHRDFLWRRNILRIFIFRELFLFVRPFALLRVTFRLKGRRGENGGVAAILPPFLTLDHCHPSLPRCIGERSEGSHGSKRLPCFHQGLFRLNPVRIVVRDAKCCVSTKFGIPCL
jgi:hypothetical protein